jgi:hypothetical protein
MIFLGNSILGNQQWILSLLSLYINVLHVKSRGLTSKLQTHPLVREGALHQETHNCQTEKKDLVMGSRQEPTPRHTGRQTVGRKLTN